MIALQKHWMYKIKQILSFDLFFLLSGVDGCLGELRKNEVDLSFAEKTIKLLFFIEIILVTNSVDLMSACCEINVELIIF